MDIRSALKSQHRAALKMLRLAIEQCPESLWDAESSNQAPVWRVAYHAMFFSNFYLQQDHRGYTTPWAGHRREMVELGEVTNGIRITPPKCDPMTRQEILAIWDVCDQAIDKGIDALDLDADPCGFPWYPMPTLEHQLVNIRHVQHHAAALAARLRQVGIEIDWVGEA